jgi:hypothetical protein
MVAAGIAIRRTRLPEYELVYISRQIPDGVEIDITFDLD